MSDAKTALVFEGPGFSEQEDVLQNLEILGYRVVRRTLGVKGVAIPELETAEFVLFRGPWAAQPEDRAFARLLAARLPSPLRVNPKQVFVGIGRGALVLLEAGALPGVSAATLSWEPAFLNVREPWTDAFVVPPIMNSLKVLVQGKAMPSIENTPEISSWLASREGAPLAWRWKRQVYLSFVDPLALSERTQMPDFGYADLSDLPGQQQVLKAFVGGAL